MNSTSPQKTGIDARGTPLIKANLKRIGFAFTVILSGCILEGTNYVIELVPQQDRLTAKYPPSGSVFPNRLPTYIYYSTQMGETYAYAERFAGNENLAKSLERMQKSADNLTDLLIGWLKMELGRDPKFKNMQHFLDKRFRSDIKNLPMYFWAYSLTGKGGSEVYSEVSVRIGHYLVEHGYFESKDLPLIFKAVTCIDSDGGEEIMAIVQQFIRKKMGYAEAKSMMVSLDFLSDVKKAKASLEKYIVTTDIYRARLKELEKDKNHGANSNEPVDFAAEMAANASGFDLAFLSDHLTLKLRCTTQPYQTNGTWDKDFKKVVWSTTIEKRENQLPTFCFALWSVPDEAFQKKHFGKIILKDERLAGYCLWRKGLTNQQGKKWDRFLLGLKPGPNLLADLNAFHFSNEQNTTPTTTSRPCPLENIPMGIIMEALTTQPSQPAKEMTGGGDSHKRIEIRQPTTSDTAPKE